MNMMSMLLIPLTNILTRLIEPRRHLIFQAYDIFSVSKCYQECILLTLKYKCASLLLQGDGLKLAMHVADFKRSLIFNNNQFINSIYLLLCQAGIGPRHRASQSLIHMLACWMEG